MRHYTTRVQAMDAYAVSQLPQEETVVFVASTTGQGEVPDSMRKFWRFLLNKNLPPNSLGATSAAVFGLGDSGYLKYNVVAKKLERRLAQLGAREAAPRGLGDDQHPSGYEAALDPWLAALWSSLRRRHPLPPTMSEPAPDDIRTDLVPKYHVTVAPAAANGAANGTAKGDACGSGGSGDETLHRGTLAGLQAAALLDRLDGGDAHSSAAPTCGSPCAVTRSFHAHMQSFATCTMLRAC